MIFALLPGLLLAMWGLSGLFDSDAPDDDEDTQIDEDYAAQGTLVETDDGTILFGTWGSDLIYGTDGDDWVTGEPAPDDPYDRDAEDNNQNDTIYLGAGDDIYSPPPSQANEGNDLVRGGAGNDTLDLYGFSDSTVYGDLGDDIIDVTDIASGLTGDVAYGGDGDDIIMADGRDEVTGGAGDDTFIAVNVDCFAPGPIVITDFEPGDTLEMVWDYHPNPGLTTITPELTADGTSMYIPGDYSSYEGQGVLLQGVTDIETLEVLIISRNDMEAYYPCD